MRALRITTLVLLAAVATGCSHQADNAAPEPTGHATPLDNPPWVLMTRGASSSQTPRPLSGEPSLAEVESAATAGPSRLDGEQYALAVAHLLTDVRPGIAGEEAVSQIASSTLAAPTRAYLVEDLDRMQQIGFRRQIDTGLEMWIRSQPHGPADTPTSMSVEAVWNLEDRVDDMHGWTRNRYDLVREDDRWKLAATGGGFYGPRTARNLTPAQQRHVLGKGPGWRRIPPAAVSPP